MKFYVMWDEGKTDLVALSPGGASNAFRTLAIPFRRLVALSSRYLPVFRLTATSEPVFVELAQLSLEEAIDPLTGELRFITDPLVDGTYSFRVDVEDAAGNRRTSMRTTSIIHNPPPATASDFLITTFVDATDTWSFTWTASPSTDLAGYALYSNHGSGMVDYSTLEASFAPGATSGSYVETGTEGEWLFGLRATDAAGPEDNVNIVARGRLEDVAGVLVLQGLEPPVPVNLVAIPRAGGTFDLSADYTSYLEEMVEGVKMDFYVAVYGDAFDFLSPPFLEVTIPEHRFQSPGIIPISGTTTALVHGTIYVFTAKARALGGQRSIAAATTEPLRADAVAPSDNKTLSSASVL